MRDNGLVLFMFGLFLASLIGLSLVGYTHNNNELAEHNQPSQSLSEYVTSGNFIEAIFENWESEFLQMATLVIATIFLYQKGAADSRKLKGREDIDVSSRYSIIHSHTWHNRGRALGKMLYSNSLSIALLFLFILSFTLHAVAGTAAYNEEALHHNQSTVSVLVYIGTAQFWFESFQNWQSEFLAVGILLLLSVYLRQKHSPESKPVGVSNKKTGR